MIDWYTNGDIAGRRLYLEGQLAHKGLAGNQAAMDLIKSTIDAERVGYMDATAFVPTARRTFARLNYPGVLRDVRPARGRIVAPAATAVTDESTVTLDDGSASRIYGFDQTGDGTVPGADRIIDISALTTASDLADALANDINNDAFLGNINIVAFHDAGDAQLRMIQIANSSNGIAEHLLYLQQGSFGAFGNNAIVFSNPGDGWVSLGMVGGRNNNPGPLMVPAAGPRRHYPVTIFVPETADPGAV